MSDRFPSVLPESTAEPSGPRLTLGLNGGPPRYWRSLEERTAPEPAHDPEFPDANQAPEGFARRQFLSLLGATAAATGAACVTKPAEEILPYTRTPPELTPGNPLHYATCVQEDGLGVGLLVTCREGRPVKVEGNPDHPASLGAAGPHHLALTLQLYDPARARLIRRDRTPTALRLFLDALERDLTTHERDGGARLRFLVEPTSSPTLLGLRERIARRFPHSKVVAFASAGRQNVYDGSALAFDQPLEPQYDFARARVVLSLDADFLAATGEHLRHARDFADGRDPSRGPLNRLYVVESLYSVTGGMADHRLRCRPSEVAAFALLLAGEIGQLAPTSAQPELNLSAAGGFAGRPEVARFARAAAKDLFARGSGAVVLAGRGQPPEVHAVAHAINAALGSEVVSFTDPATPDIESGSRGLAKLAEEMRSGRVDTLCITAKDPAYGAPADLDFTAAMHRVANVIYTSLHEDETAAHCRWFIPATHPFEAWSDARAVDGTASLCQPLIAPLFSGVSELQLFAAFLSEGDKSSYALVREHWSARLPGPDFEERWARWLGRGIVEGTKLPTLTRAAFRDRSTRALRDALARQPGPGLEIAFYADAKVGDGRFANVAWLQELPDPITKLTWDNAALVSPRTAARLQVSTGELLKLSLKGRQVAGPALIVPGQADDVVGVALGYGRDGEERVEHRVGFNAGAIRGSDAPWFAVGLDAERMQFERRAMATTQQHWSTEGRPIAMTVNEGEYRRHPEELTREHRGPLPTLQKPVEYPEAKWGMAVDLSRCTGCSACMVACQAENNVPVVGREQVLRSREMHWLRIDRYFEGNLDSPAMVPQPVMCQHCEAAPCEYVCPTNATVHSDEGLNEMIYNRCVGTRYCQNNCPYKVRRFNFLHFTAPTAPVQKLGMNPDVTVRARGVMEKCTYCVQRIERARIDSRLKDRPLREAPLKTACQQACPTQAIVFGDLNDPRSEVAARHAEPRRYDLLHDLNTRPRTAYLLRLKNPNPELL